MAFLVVLLLMAPLLLWDAPPERNGVGFDGSGAVFSQPGALHTDGFPSSLYRGTRNAAGLTLELRLSGARVDGRRHARIFSFSSGWRTRGNLRVVQDRDELSVSVAHADRTIHVPDVFPREGPTVILVSMDETGARVYIDGELRGQTARTPGAPPFPSFHENHALVIGNDGRMGRAWTGRLHRVALYDVAVDRVASGERAARVPVIGLADATPLLLYDFLIQNEGLVPNAGMLHDLDLVVPERLHRVLPRTLLGGLGLRDFIQNLGLFLPLGFVLGMANRRFGWQYAVITALAAGAVCSAFFETGQLFLSSRYSSVFDVLANSLGAGIGALAAVSSFRWFRKAGGGNRFAEPR